MTIIEKIWEYLDNATGYVMENAKNKPSMDSIQLQAFNESRGNARGLSIALYELCVPGYTDSTAVAKHAVARYKAALAGAEMPPTVGINNYNPHLDEARSKEQTAIAKDKAATKTKPAAAGKQLTDDEKASVTGGIKADLPLDTLAKVYKVDVSVIEALAAEIKES